MAPRLAATRWQANHATAWLALSSGFLRLWISDEVHMIQMPFVVMAAWAALRYPEHPSRGRAAALGAAVGLAALAFVSNLLLGVTLGAALALWHRARREPRAGLHAAAAVALGAALAAGPVLLAGWLSSPQAPAFLSWLTRYGGGVHPSRVEAAYGLAGSAGRLGESAVRALYGAASALVDLAPIAAAARDRQIPSAAAVTGALACLAAAAVMLRGLGRAWRHRERPAARATLLVAIPLPAAVLAFGLFWNNSDDQFYFQLAPAFAALAARARAKGRAVAILVAGASLFGLLWNVVDVGSRFVLYPRHERMALLEHEVRGACLAVYPGFDEPERLLALSPEARAVERLAVTDLAIRHPAGDGLRLLAGRIERCLAGRGRVVLVDVFDTPPARGPWKFLRRLGYDRDVVERALTPLPLEPASRRVGPFTIRSTR